MARHDRFNDAVLLIDKPSGVTSFDVLRQVRRILGVKKIGHAGTLDKFASGLLVVCTGMMTKLTRFFLLDDKEYLGTLRLGISTETDDGEGAVIAEAPVTDVTIETIRRAAERYHGTIVQVPPTYSALKLQGARASERARKGETVVLAARPVTIHELEVSSFDPGSAMADIRVFCSKGTYIRSLARDLGRDLGTGAYLAALRRTRSGRFTVKDAISPARLAASIEDMSHTAPFRRDIREALAGFGTLTVSPPGARRVLNGAPFPREDLLTLEKGEGDFFIIFNEDEKLIAIASIDIDKWHLQYLNVFNSHNDNQSAD